MLDVNNKNGKGNISLGRHALNALTRPRIAMRGRQTGEDFTTFAEQVLQPPDPTASWKTLQTQRKNLLNLPYAQLAKIALDLSPLVNKGLSDFLRFANPAHTLVDANEDMMAERATAMFISQLNTIYGSFKTHLDAMWAGVFIGGALFIELVLDDTGMMPVDIAVNDPLTARFKRVQDPVRGDVWMLGQDTTRGFKSLDNDPLIKYIGFDRLPNSPFGRPLLGPSVHASLILLTLIDILQRMFANQGLSRMDYEVDTEELLSLIASNPDIAGDDEATAQFINDQLSKVQNVLENLDPDADYVHLSTVKVNYATSPTMTGTSSGLNAIIQDLQRDVVNGFKGVSALSNILDSTTETHIRQQLEYYVSMLQSFQDEVAGVLSDFFTLGNQVQGIASEMKFTFSRQRTSDKKAQAELESLQTDTILKKLDAGLINEDEALAEITAIRDANEV